MNKKAYLHGFIKKCSDSNINPGALIKFAEESRFDNPIWKDIGRKMYRGLWGSRFLFPSRRYMEVKPGDTWPVISKLTGVPAEFMQKHYGQRPLTAGSVVRLH